MAVSGEFLLRTFSYLLSSTFNKKSHLAHEDISLGRSALILVSAAKKNGRTGPVSLNE